MNIFIMLLIISVVAYTLSYAKYNWSIHNRLGAIGLVLLTVITFVMATFILFVFD